MLRSKCTSHLSNHSIASAIAENGVRTVRALVNANQINRFPTFHLRQTFLSEPRSTVLCVYSILSLHTRRWPLKQLRGLLDDGSRVLTLSSVTAARLTAIVARAEAHCTHTWQANRIDYLTIERAYLKESCSSQSRT